MHPLRATSAISDAGAPHFTALENHTYCNLVTLRRSGTPVATPVWFALDGSRLYVKTETPSGKVKRIRNDPRVRVAPCTIAGRDLGPAIDGTARILPPAETPHAEAMLRRRYGWGRRLFTILIEPIFEWRDRAPVYLEIRA
jgi:PPOX class probable F420-dependent enzyme